MKDDIILLLKYLIKVFVCSIIAIPLLILAVFACAQILPADFMFPIALLLGIIFGIIDIAIASFWWANKDLDNFP